MLEIRDVMNLALAAVGTLAAIIGIRLTMQAKERVAHQHKVTKKRVGRLEIVGHQLGSPRF